LAAFNYSNRVSLTMDKAELVCITDKPISPETVVNRARTAGSGCVVTYVGLIRDESRGKSVLAVEYEDGDGKAPARLGEIAAEIKRQYPVNNVAIYHRVGKLNVGDINLVVAIAAAHRGEGFAASQATIDLFKKRLPTSKKETYADGSVWAGD
jgi:molybdopterin synthase catalytic subunit